MVNRLCILIGVYCLLRCVSPLAAAVTCDCAGCGAGCEGEWICRPQLVNQPVENQIWDAVCERICVGGCGACGLTSGCAGYNEGGCDTASSCDSPGGCCDGQIRPLGKWFPSLARVRTRNRLVRKTVIDPVTTLRFVAEPACSPCVNLTGHDACLTTSSHLTARHDEGTDGGTPVVMPVTLYLNDEGDDRTLAPIVKAADFGHNTLSSPVLLDEVAGCAPIVAAGDYNSSPEYIDQPAADGDQLPLAAPRRGYALSIEDVSRADSFAAPASQGSTVR